MSLLKSPQKQIVTGSFSVNATGLSPGASASAIEATFIAMLR